MARHGRAWRGKARPGRARQGMDDETRPTFVLTLDARPGTDSIRALRSLLKIAGRQFHLRCVDAYEIPQPQPERTRAHEIDNRAIASGGCERQANSRRDGGSRRGADRKRARAEQNPIPEL